MKLSLIERSLIAAAKMPPPAARQVLMLICQGGMTTTQDVEQPLSEGQKHYAKREKIINRMLFATNRTLDYVRHETLRNCEKHFRETAAIASAEETQPDETPEPSGLSARITFDRNRFAEELMAALREEAETALGVAGQQLFDEIGLDDVFKVPDKAAVKFLDSRENLLSKASDEIHQDVMSTIQDGLEHGDTKKELMTRIETAFSGIKESRASAIANTETAAAFNFARDQAMRKAGITHKKWLHSQSSLIKEPRPTHVEADGLIVPIDDPFDVGGVKFMYPSDDSLGAGPEDIINCHCVAIPVEAPIESGDEPGHPFRGNQYVEGLKELGVEEVDLPRNKALNKLTVEAVEKAKAAGFTVPKRITSKNFHSRAIAYGSGEGLSLTKGRINEETLHAQVSSGYWSQHNPVLHEIGHLEHERAIGIDRYDHLSTWMNPEHSRPIALKVSKYAAVNPHEFISETFAGHLSGKRYPSDVMQHYYQHGGPKLPE